MSRTRNQRRRDLWFDRLITAVIIALLIACLVGLCKQCKDIEALQTQINGTRVTIIDADAFLPKGFDAESAAYQAASHRYDIENGYIIPEISAEKETAPESANSEADRCKGAS